MFSAGRKGHGALKSRVFDVTYFNTNGQAIYDSRWNWWERRWHSGDVLSLRFAPILPRSALPNEEVRGLSSLERKRAKDAQYYKDRKVEIQSKQRAKKEKQEQRRNAKRKHNTFLREQVDQDHVVVNDAVYGDEELGDKAWICNRCSARNSERNKGCAFCLLQQVRPVQDSRIKGIDKWRQTQAVNERVDEHLVKEARSRNQEEDLDESELEWYDSENEAFNEKDERETKFHRSQSKIRVKGKKRLSQVMLTRAINTEYWNSLMEEPPESIDESLRYAHIAFPPREGARTHGAFARNLRLNEPESVQQYLTKSQFRIFKSSGCSWFYFRAYPKFS